MIRLFAVRLTVILVFVAVLASLEGLIDRDPEHAKPPKAGRIATVHLGTPLPPAVNGADPDGTYTLAVAVYLQEQDRQERERIAAYLDALEQTRRADAAAQEAARLAATRPPPSAPAPSRGTSNPTGCDGHVIPGEILIGESGCSYDAVNPTGCDGNGCYGLYQESGAHFAAGGACAGLDWHSPADQDQCAAILSNGGTNLAPWGR